MLLLGIVMLMSMMFVRLTNHPGERINTRGKSSFHYSGFTCDEVLLKLCTEEDASLDYT